MGEASLGAKAPDLVSDSAASSSRGPPPAEVVWPPHAYADVNMAVDYANGVPVSLHQPQHHYERQEFVATDRESALVVYHEEPYSQQQPSSGMETFIQVPFGGLHRLAVATFRESPIPVSDAQQQAQHYEQEIEQRAADEMVAMSQVLDLHRSVAPSTSRDTVVDIPASLHSHHAHHLTRPSSSSSSPPPPQSPALLVLPGSADESVGALRLESQLTVGPESAATLGLPMLLDKASLALCSSSASSSALSSLGPSTSSGSRGAIGLATHLSQRYLLEQAQYLVADLASKELLPSILQSPCSSGPSTSTVVPSAGSSSSSSSVHGLNFSLAAAKALLATQQQSQQHKFGAGSSALQHAGPSSVASGSVAAMDASPEHLEAEPLDTGDEEGVLDSSSSAGPGALLEVHPAGAVPLYGNVFVTERGEVALVSSTGQDSEDLLEVSGLARICDVQQYHAANQVCHQNSAIQNYVSSSADLVATSNGVEPGIHSTVDSTDSSEHVITSEAYVDTSSQHHHHHHHHHHLQEDSHGADYGQQLDLSSTVEASTSSRSVQHSVLRMQGILGRRLPDLAGSPSSSRSLARAEVCSAGVSQEELEELQNASTVTGGLHPDSTNSPIVDMAPSPVNAGALDSPGPSHSPGPSAGSANSRADADRDCTSRYWCDDCNQFYEHECPRHKVQLIVDKPVLTRAWASLPASYLYVHKVAEDSDGEPIYGVFAKKNIPKRTQFGPMEGVLQRRTDRPQQFPLFVREDENGSVFCLDTSDETQSNWMRFVRPAQTPLEQNIIVIQQGTSLYFNTTRALSSRTELRVWYSTAYAQRWGLPLLHQQQQQQQEPLQLEHRSHQSHCSQQEAIEHQQRQQQQQQQQQQVDQLQQQQLHQPIQQQLQQHQQPYQEVHLQHPQQQHSQSQQQHPQPLQQHPQPLQQHPQPLQQNPQPLQQHPQPLQQHQQQHLQQESTRIVGAKHELCKQWACFECSSAFGSSEQLQLHLNQHEKVPGTNGDNASATAQPQPSPATVTLADPVNVDADSLAFRVRGRPPKKQHAARAPLEEMHSLGNESVHTNQSCGTTDATNPVEEVAKPTSGDENQCNVCHKVFQRKYGLKRHLMMHSSEKKYKCSLCDLRFSHPYNRKRHVIRHQQKDERLKQRRQQQAQQTQQAQQQQQQQPLGSLLSEGVRKSARRSASQAETFSWGCPHCRYVFPSSDLLNLHLPLHAVVTPTEPTPESQLEQCPECGSEFSTQAELMKHVGVHGKRGPPKRVKQPSEAASAGEAENETASAGAPVPQRVHKCSLCYKGFATEDRLSKHYQVHGNDETKPLKCDTCDKRFLNTSALTEHLKTHKKERYFECPICKEKFHVVAALKEHVFVHKEDGMYTCPTCGKKFAEYNQVRKHIRAFHTNQRFMCQQCPKVFCRQDKLKLHMLCHSEHREFLCALCGRQFKRKDKLKEHTRRLHAPDREAREQARAKAARPLSSKRFVPKVPPTDYQRFIYKCHTCMLGFKRRGMLVNHMAKRHPNVQLELVPELNLPILRATRDYYCQYCEKVYRSSSKRKAHILKNHPGAALPMSNRVKGGVPSIPGQPNPTFSHMVGSVTTQPHSCCLCHKQYASKAKLLQHQRKKHMEMVALFGTTNNQAVNGSNRGREADLLTRAMSELTQGLTDFRQNSGSTTFLTTRSLQEVDDQDEGMADTQQEQVITETLDATVETTEVAASTLDPAQINLLLAQYQQQAALSATGEGDTDVPVVSVADVVVAPNAQAGWTIVSVSAPGEEAFEQELVST
ncbi:uncharacterized protein LOC142583144 isoform X1 [Dermacentor variabilis]|uniref:uncharacterized protein LOC142583144 isoform X1 n=1 Tax=Dermacentor variabilis TaxID=34621 RepID=UPI003F5CB53E